MKYNQLIVEKKPAGKRVGRGIAAGQGKTAGRGTKGQRSRTGSGRKPGFEGGQTPLMQRLPKLPGFRSIRPKAETVYTGQLDAVGAKVNNQTLAEVGLVSSPYVRVKLIANGPVTKKCSVSLQAASASAIKAVQKAGGSFEVVPQVKRPAKPAKQDKKA